MIVNFYESMDQNSKGEDFPNGRDGAFPIHMKRHRGHPGLHDYLGHRDHLDHLEHAGHASLADHSRLVPTAD